MHHMQTHICFQTLVGIFDFSIPVVNIQYVIKQKR